MRCERRARAGTRAAQARIVVALALAATALAGLSTAPAAAAPKPPLDHAGRWLTDADGRVVILRGWNMVNKHPPYQPSAAGFGRDDARFLARHGFNTLRLGMIYAGLEPEPGDVRSDYLRQTAETVRILAEEGIFVLLDFHQDMYNERFEGEGFPDWAVVGEARTLPAEPRLGFPLNYVAMPALQRAFDLFWENARADDGRGLQDALAAAWRRVAQRFRGEPYVLGYNFLNEPWPGSQWQSCANPAGCPAFDRLLLTPFSERVIEAIREVDPATLAWYAPNVLFDFGADTHHGDTGDPHAGLAFNMYCLAEPVGDVVEVPDAPGPDECEAGYELTLDNAEAHSADTGAALLLTEFAATDDLDVVRGIADLADQRMLSWQQWHYCDCDDPTTTADPVSSQALVIDPSRPPRGDNVKRAKLRASARPYPRAVAGTPLELDFDYDAPRLELRYSTQRAGGEGRFPGGSVSEVFVPRLHYPDGYAARADGARVVSRPAAQVLRLRSCPGAREISLRVSPEGRTTMRCRGRANGEEEEDGREDDEGTEPPERDRTVAGEERRRAPAGGASTTAGSGALPSTGLVLAGLLAAVAGLIAAGALIRRLGHRGS